MKIEPAQWSSDTLVRALRQDSREAFECLVKTYSGDLLDMATRLTRSTDDAEDLVQDVLLDIWEHRKELHIESSLSGYLHTSLKYKFFRRISRDKLHQEAMKHWFSRINQMQHSILDVMAAKDLEQSLSELVAELPENMQRIFVLRNEDYSLREIAQALGLAEQTVKSYHSELNRRIRTGLLAKHPEISHSLLVAILIKFI